MFDRFLSNPTLVLIAAAAVTVIVGCWRYLDLRSDPHARRPNSHRRGRHDDG